MHNVITDFDFAPDGSISGVHTVDIDNPEVIDALSKIASGEVDAKKAGWLEPTRCPGHIDGTTRLDVLKVHCVNESTKDKLAPVMAAFKKG